MIINKDSSIPLYIQIQRLLHQQINSGDFKPGTQIPSEHELAEQFSVSRMTARKSIEALVSRGFLYRSPGKGTFVIDDDMSYGFSTMLSFSRTLTERGHLVETDVLRQEEILAPMQVREKLDLASGADVIVVRRLRKVDGRPIAIHTSYLEAALFAEVLETDLVKESLLETMEYVCGIRTAFTKDSVTAALANLEDAKLLGYSEPCPVLDVTGQAYDDKGKPIRFTRAIYRGDGFKLVMKNTHDQASRLAITPDS